MRTLLAAIDLWFATIILAPLAVMASVLGFHDERGGAMQQWCMRTWARSLCLASGVRVVVHGRENITQGIGTVYASNHVSWYDIFAIASVLPGYTFVAKAELRKIPIFGWGAEGAGVVFLAREDRKSAFEAYKDVAKKIEHGLNVVVYPEGTRSGEYALRPFPYPRYLRVGGVRWPWVVVVDESVRIAISRFQTPADLADPCHVHRTREDAKVMQGCVGNHQREVGRRTSISTRRSSR